MTGKKIHFINLRILKLLKEQRKSYEHLADYLGIPSPLNVKQQLLSKESPGEDQLREIAVFLGVNFTDLIAETFVELRSPGIMLLDQVPEDLLSGLLASLAINHRDIRHYREYKEYKDTKELVQELKLCWN